MSEEQILYDVKTERFEDIVTKLVADYKDKTTEEIIAITDKVCEEYVMHFNRKPDAYQLTLLASLVMKDDISNPAPNKVQKEAYPFHSEAQRKRRKRKEFSTMAETLEFINFKSKANLSTSPPRDVTI